jgi:hypothetical protein
MENENTQVEEEVVLQEDQTTTETEETVEETQDEDTVTISKADLTKLKRKAFAYDSNKKETPRETPKETPYNVTPEKLERIELRQDGYSKEEVEAIMDLGGTKALKNPLVKSAIDQMRKKAQSDDANVNLSSKSPVYKKFTQEDLNKMSLTDLEKILPRD